MKGLVGEAAQGSADCRKNWTTALIQRLVTPTRNVPRHRVLLGKEAGTKGLWESKAAAKTGIASLPLVRLAPRSAPGPTGERQEHLDVIDLLRWSWTEEASVSGTRHYYN